jgi:hypothetical protein
MSPSPSRLPSFAKDFPSHAGLASVVKAFARGDYARVRTEAAKLAASDEPDDVRRAARALLERTQADPLAIGLLALAGALLVLLTGYWIVHGKAPAENAPLRPPVEHVR